MAKTTSPEHPHHGHDDAPAKTDLTSIIMHIQARPLPYLGAVAFVVLVLIVTGLYRMSQASSYKKAADEYARAADIEDAKERATALGTLVSEGTALTPRALYMQGEAALEAGDKEGARAAFTKLRESYPDYEFIPESVEGLALLAEDDGNFAAARALYEEVVAKWPNSPTSKRQPFNIARCLEGEGELALAVEKYRDQIEEFPGSTIAVRAQARLDELRASNPELFPVETPAIQELQTSPDAAATPEENAPAAPAEESAAPEAAAPETAPAEQPAETPPATPQQ